MKPGLGMCPSCTQCLTHALLDLPTLFIPSALTGTWGQVALSTEVMYELPGLAKLDAKLHRLQRKLARQQYKSKGWQRTKIRMLLATGGLVVPARAQLSQSQICLCPGILYCTADSISCGPSPVICTGQAQPPQGHVAIIPVHAAMRVEWETQAWLGMATLWLPAN